MSQLALRNGSANVAPGQLGQPGIFMLGYSDPAVLEAAQRRDWQGSTQRSGAKLLVLAVNQLTGQVTRLSSDTPRCSTPPRFSPQVVAPARSSGISQPSVHSTQKLPPWRPPTRSGITSWRAR